MSPVLSEEWMSTDAEQATKFEAEHSLTGPALGPNFRTNNCTKLIKCKSTKNHIKQEIELTITSEFLKHKST